MLRLQASDPDVLALTRKALVMSQDSMPTLTVRCAASRCGRPLAHAGMTKYGPLFTSSWSVPSPSGIVLNGELLTRQLYKQGVRNPAFTVRGDPPQADPRTGVIALLALPPTFEQDYPDLLVRCKHGDLVLERREVIDRIDSGKWPVTMARPFHEYEEPISEWLDGLGVTETTKTSYTFGGGRGYSRAELDELLNRHTRGLP